MWQGKRRKWKWNSKQENNKLKRSVMMKKRKGKYKEMAEEVELEKEVLMTDIVQSRNLKLFAERPTYFMKSKFFSKISIIDRC